uniref:Uncharacterized protein n=2 Tax=Lotharella globosa TaxID=91324 RepID=A0A7S4DEV6_9EUKA
MNLSSPPGWIEWVKWAENKEQATKKMFLLKNLLRHLETYNSQRDRLQNELRDIEASNTIFTLLKRAKKRRQKEIRAAEELTHKKRSEKSPNSKPARGAGPWMRGWWISQGTKSVKPHAISVSQGLHSYEARTYSVDEITRKFGKVMSAPHVIDATGADQGMGYMVTNDEGDHQYRALSGASSVPILGTVDVGQTDLGVLTEDPNSALDDDVATSEDDDINMPDVEVVRQMAQQEAPLSPPLSPSTPSTTGLDIVGGPNMDMSFISDLYNRLDAAHSDSDDESDSDREQRKNGWQSNWRKYGDMGLGRRNPRGWDSSEEDSESEYQEASLQIVGIQTLNNIDPESIRGELLWQMLVREERLLKETKDGSGGTKAEQSKPRYKRRLVQQAMGSAQTMALMSLKSKCQPGMQPIIAIVPSHDAAANEGQTSQYVQLVGGAQVQSAIDAYSKGIRAEHIDEEALSPNIIPIEVDFGPLSALVLFNKDTKGIKLQGMVLSTTCPHVPAQIIRVSEDEMLVSIESRWPKLTAREVRRKIKHTILKTAEELESELEKLDAEGGMVGLSNEFDKANGMMFEPDAILRPADDLMDHIDLVDTTTEEYDEDDVDMLDEESMRMGAVASVSAPSPEAAEKTRVEEMLDINPEALLKAVDNIDADLISNIVNLWTENTLPLRYKRVHVPESEDDDTSAAYDAYMPKVTKPTISDKSLQGFFAGVFESQHELFQMRLGSDPKTGKKRLEGIKIAGDGATPVGEPFFYALGSPRSRSSRSGGTGLSVLEPPYDQIGADARFDARYRLSDGSWAKCELLVLGDDSPAKMNAGSLAVYIPPSASDIEAKKPGDVVSGGLLVNLYEVRLTVDEKEEEIGV